MTVYFIVICATIPYTTTPILLLCAVVVQYANKNITLVFYYTLSSCRYTNKLLISLHTPLAAYYSFILLLSKYLITITESSNTQFLFQKLGILAILSNTILFMPHFKYDYIFLDVILVYFYCSYKGSHGVVDMSWNAKLQLIIVGNVDADDDLRC